MMAVIPRCRAETAAKTLETIILSRDYIDILHRLTRKKSGGDVPVTAPKYHDIVIYYR